MEDIKRLISVIVTEMTEEDDDDMGEWDRGYRGLTQSGYNKKM